MDHPEEKMTCIVFQRRKKLHRLKCPGIHEGYPVVSQHQSQYTSGAKLCAGVVSANNAIPVRPVVVLKGALCSLIITAMTVGKPSTTRYEVVGGSSTKRAAGVRPARTKAELLIKLGSIL